MKKRYNKTYFFIAFAGTVLILWAIPHSHPDEENSMTSTTPTASLLWEGQVEEPVRNVASRPSRLWSYDACFNDSQAVQLSAATEHGVRPVESRDELQHHLNRHELVDIRHNPLYHVDVLHHSVPFLVPKAERLLQTIALNFLDSLQSKHLPLHRPIVTSVMRTESDVSRLKRGNSNALTQSCHLFGTTIDITYNRFKPIGPQMEETRYDDRLKFVLGEVLNDLRLEGRCYVKYERKQACFHLTVR